MREDRRAQRPTRRRRTTLAALAGCCAVALVATGCGGGADDGEVTLRFSWWGADERHAETQEVIERFEAENPGITVEGEYADWSSYWDRLATNVAANDAPDIIQHEERYLREYGDRGALADLHEFEDVLDLSTIDELALGGGEVDGELYGVATGVNAYGIIADPEIFDQAGVEMPDDTTWTWDDYAEIAAEISENTPDGVYGAQNYGFNEAGFNIFARQRGEALYTADGGLGFSQETLADWWELSLELQESGAEPDAARSVETESGGVDRSLIATNAGAMYHSWSNHLGILTNTSGRELQMLRYPRADEEGPTGLYLKPAMYYSVSARSEHPREAAMFVDFLLNDPQAAEIILADRGLPANLELREQIRGDLEQGDAVGAEFIDEISAEIDDALPVPPIGAGEVVDLIKRVNEDVLFGRLSPDEAAERFMADVESATG
ncbi:ABC transporter substrate-binding protein [Marinitenerispora sediminis]|uniref:Sugar-binding protein n=1 Tax=Marinitenerispora sediminis TaxID=1931232 RepID=A0A368T1U6_9ACTN|nr:ABC transporter substrate-binding protein [Marinitenerispora sediminis]RCV54730.1 sugar-binding protein [Marinitenerispora sediminis]RCV54983.1 sugar-binding protein [Marinitenerispora sediminis]RCV59981.1 sugar-binding protein [Marinitenerispora sediminis]